MASDRRAGPQSATAQDAPASANLAPATGVRPESGEKLPLWGPRQVCAVTPDTGCEPFTEMCVKQGLRSGTPISSLRLGAQGPPARAGRPGSTRHRSAGLRQVPDPTVTPLRGEDVSPPAQGLARRTLRARPPRCGASSSLLP